MSHLVLRSLNAPGFILLVTIGIALQTALFTSHPLMAFQPDVVLLAVVWFAMRRGFTEGGILTLLVANIAEIHSSVPSGVYLTTYMIIYLLIRAMSRFLLINKMTSLVGTTLFSTFVWQTLEYAMLRWLEVPAQELADYLVRTSLAVAVNGLVGFWIFKWFESFDWSTYYDPRARQEQEDEWQLRDEGL